MPNLYYKIVLILCLLIAYQLHAQDDLSESEIQQKLDIIKVQLGDLKNDLNKAIGEEAKILRELEKQDQKINSQGKLIRQTEQNISKSQQQLEALNHNIDKKIDSIAVQKKQIAQLLKLHIYINHDRIIKMILLNPETRTAEITQHQIKYLQHKLYSMISTIAEQIRQLSDIKAQLAEQQVKLIEHKQLLNSENKILQQQKKQRVVVLKSLKKTISQYQSESQTLNMNKDRLFSLLTQINDLLDDLPDDLGNNTIFSQLKGHLDQPLLGKIIRSYRSLRAGQSKWDGIVIGNQTGTEVESVAYGRVAFADWLRGYGLLIVIEHGDEYMTLYGHNQSLLVEPGDWVQAKQVIATSGNSGNIDANGLYFEIRKQAQPTNPVPWFQR